MTVGFYSQIYITTENGHNIAIGSDKGGIGNFALAFKAEDLSHNALTETDPTKRFVHYRTTVGEAKSNLAKLGKELNSADMSNLDEWSKFFIESKLIFMRELFGKLNHFKSDYIFTADDSESLSYCFDENNVPRSELLNENAVVLALSRLDNILKGNENGKVQFNPQIHTHNKYAGWADNGNWIRVIDEGVRSLFSTSNRGIEVVEVGTPQPGSNFLDVPVTFRYKTGFKSGNVTDIMWRAKTDALTLGIYQTVSPRGMDVVYPKDKNNTTITYHSDSNNIYIDVDLQIPTR